MKITTRRDVQAPPEAVFDALSDFGRFEAQGRAGGAEVERTDPGERPEEASWRIRAEIRGARRDVAARVVAFDRPEQIALQAEGDGIAALLNFEVTARPGGGAVLFASVAARAGTLRGRLLLKALALARATLAAQLEARIDRFAHGVERRAATGD